MSNARTSLSQFETILEFMESHGDLASQGGGPEARVQNQRLWAELSNALNSDGSGRPRDVKTWRKVWADWKNKTKKKASAISISQRRTGGGAGTTVKLTDLEKRLLGFLGPDLIFGNNAPECGLPFDQQVHVEVPMELHSDVSEFNNPPLSSPEEDTEGNQLTEQSGVWAAVGVPGSSGLQRFRVTSETRADSGSLSEQSIIGAAVGVPGGSGLQRATVTVESQATDYGSLSGSSRLGVAVGVPGSSGLQRAGGGVSSLATPTRPAAGGSGVMSATGGVSSLATPTRRAAGGSGFMSGTGGFSASDTPRLETGRPAAGGSRLPSGRGRGRNGILEIQREYLALRKASEKNMEKREQHQADNEQRCRIIDQMREENEARRLDLEARRLTLLEETHAALVPLIAAVTELLRKNL